MVKRRHLPTEIGILCLTVGTRGVVVERGERGVLQRVGQRVVWIASPSHGELCAELSEGQDLPLPLPLSLSLDLTSEFPFSLLGVSVLLFVRRCFSVLSSALLTALLPTRWW
jgi:hypothetical protein